MLLKKPTKQFAIGMVVKDRWDLTEQTLQSIINSQQPHNTYDLFIIDNASTDENRQKLKKMLKKGKLPLANAFFLTTEVSISEAYNLFMAITQDYNYRVKYDNDIVLKSTVIRKPPSPKKNLVSGSHMSALDGAPMSVSIIRGVQSVHRKRPPSHTRFLDHLRDFMDQHDVGIAALISCPPNATFGLMFNEMSRKMVYGRHFLNSGCLMIDKYTFDKIGYFYENMPRKIDIEYSQRAIRAGINIGYHPFFWSVHIGLNKPTESPTVLQSKIELANHNLLADIPQYCDTVWNKVLWKILPASYKHSLININTDNYNQHNITAI